MGMLSTAMLRFGLRVPEYEEDDYEEYEETNNATVTPIRADEEVDQDEDEYQEAFEMARIVTIRPISFRDATQVGEPLKEGVPVIVNLTNATDGDAHRLLDFISGVVFALDCTIQKVTTAVFLLAPSGIDIQDEKPSRRLDSQAFSTRR